MNSNTITEFLNKGIELNFNDSRVIGMFVGAIVAGIVFLILFVWLTLKAQKIAKHEGVMLFNILHIIIFGVPVAGIAFIPFFQQNFVLWCVISAIMWIIPFVLNISQIGKSGILFSILQFIFALLICSVVGAVIVGIFIIIALVFTDGMWVEDSVDFFVYDCTTGRTIGVIKTGKGSFVDTDGNNYMHTGVKNEYVDDMGNVFLLKVRK